VTKPVYLRLAESSLQEAENWDSTQDGHQFAVRYRAIANAYALVSIAVSLEELVDVLDNRNRLEELKAGVEMTRR